MGALEAMNSHSLRGCFKQSLRKTLAATYHYTGMWTSRHRGNALILAYHRVLSRQELRKRYVQPGMYVLDDVFEAQIRFLKTHFDILSFTELLERWKNRDWNSRHRYCVITFDDGWADNYRFAYPILRKYQVPAIVFLVTDYIGTNQWLWPEKLSYLLEQYRTTQSMTPAAQGEIFALFESLGIKEEFRVLSNQGTNTIAFDDEVVDSVIEQCKRLPYETIDKLVSEMAAILEKRIPEERMLLNWEEVTQMSNNDIIFGSHSCTHRILTTLSGGEAKRELEQSHRTLLEKPINYAPIFCYPNGNYNSDLETLVKQSGYEAAVGYQFGFEAAAPKDLYGLRRIGIHNDITSTVPLFSFHLSGLTSH